ncbi:MAG: phage head closure protein [Hyphomicrobiales bacterium]
MSRPSIGALRRRVTLQRPLRDPDDGGGVAKTWEDVAVLWAGVSALSGHEAVAAGRLSGNVTHRARIRHRADVEPEMRFALGARVLAIVSATDPDGRRRWLDCHCEERDL